MSLKRLTNLGVSDKNSPIENRRIKLLNLILLTVISFLTFYIIFNLFNGSIVVAIIQTVLLTLYCSSFYFQKINKPLITTNLLIISLQVFLAFNILVLNPGRMGEYVLFLVLFLQLIFYTNRALILLCYLLNIGLFYAPQIILEPYPSENYSWVTPLVTFGAIPLIVYFFNNSWLRYESELNQKNAILKHLLDERAKLMNIVAHDLKSPLSRIEGLVDILARKGLSKDEDDLINMIKNESREQSEMIKKVLNLYSNESFGSEDDLQVSSINIVSLIEEIYNSFQHKFQEKKIAFYKVFEDENLEALVDPTFFKSVIENLVSNALKYCKPHSEVSIKAYVERDLVSIKISDNGPGISKNDQKKLFIPGAVTSSNYKDSTGIGLSIVHYFTHKMGGDITFQSDLGKGTTFKLTFKKGSKV